MKPSCITGLFEEMVLDFSFLTGLSRRDYPGHSLQKGRL